MWQYPINAAQFTACEGWTNAVSWDASFVALRASHNWLPLGVWNSTAQFTDEFAATYGTEPAATPFPAGQAMAVLDALTAGLRLANSVDREALRAALHALNGSSPYAHWGLNDAGVNVAHRFVTVTVREGRYVQVSSDGKVEGTEAFQYPVRWSWAPRRAEPNVGVQAALGSLASLGLLLTLIAMALFYLLRHSLVIKAFSFRFSVIIQWGLLCGFTAVLLLALPAPVTGATCRAANVLAHLCFVLVFGSMCARNYRLSRLFHHKALQPVVLTDQHLLLRLGVVVLALAIYLALWLSMGGFGAQELEQVDPLNSATLVFTRCANEGSQRWSTALLSMESFSLLAGVVLSIRNRAVPSKYSESTFLALLTYNTTVVSGVAIGLLYSGLLDTHEPAAAMPFVAAALLLCCWVCFALLVASQLLTIALSRWNRRSGGVVGAVVGMAAGSGVKAGGRAGVAGAPGGARMFLAVPQQTPGHVNTSILQHLAGERNAHEGENSGDRDGEGSRRDGRNAVDGMTPGGHIRIHTAAIRRTVARGPQPTPAPFARVVGPGVHGVVRVGSLVGFSLPVIMGRIGDDGADATGGAEDDAQATAQPLARRPFHCSLPQWQQQPLHSLAQYHSVAHSGPAADLSSLLSTSAGPIDFYLGDVELEEWAAGRSEAEAVSPVRCHLSATVLPAATVAAPDRIGSKEELQWHTSRNSEHPLTTNVAPAAVCPSRDLSAVFDSSSRSPLCIHCCSLVRSTPTGPTAAVARTATTAPSTRSGR
jgi:hypothetical protein